MGKIGAASDLVNNLAANVGTCLHNSCDRLLFGSSPLGSGRDNSILPKLVALATKAVPPLAELQPDVPPALGHGGTHDAGRERRTAVCYAKRADALSSFCSGPDLAALLK